MANSQIECAHVHMFEFLCCFHHIFVHMYLYNANSQIEDCFQSFLLTPM